MNHLENTVSELAIKYAQALVDMNFYKSELEKAMQEVESLKMEVVELRRKEDENETNQ